MAAKLPESNSFYTTRKIIVEGVPIPKGTFVQMNRTNAFIYLQGREYIFYAEEFMQEGPLLLEDDSEVTIRLPEKLAGTKENPEDGQRFTFTKNSYVGLDYIEAGS